MLARIILFLVFGGVSLAVFKLTRWWLHRRLQGLSQQDFAEAVQSLALPARPAILYFTTANCAQCRFQQTPALERLRQSWGESVHIRKLDAIEYDHLARRFGIMTVPSTVVLDRQRRLVAINHGLADTTRLDRQLRSLRPSPLPPSPPRRLVARGT